MDQELEIKRLRDENEVLRNACATGWGEPTLVNILRKEVAEQKARAEAAEALHRSCYADLDATSSRESDALTLLRNLYQVLRDRHHGRMPDEVQKAYDAAGDALRNIGITYEFVNEGRNGTDT